jgi:TolB-like protein
MIVHAAPLTVAVFGFNDADKHGGEYGGKVTTLVTASLTTEPDIIMVERMELKKALGEQALGASGMVNSEQAAKIGQITGAKVLVSGQVIKTDKSRLVIVANIVGTETGRLFAQKVEGPTENLTDLTSELSHKIAQTIHEQSSSFIAENKSHEDYLNRIVKSVTGTNRPTVSVTIHWPQSVKSLCVSANTELGLILQKAGFTVVDGQSESKPDIEITGQVETDAGPTRGHLHSSHAVIDLKVQERRTGKILIIEHQTADAVDIGQAGARKAACASAADSLAERILPKMAE